MMHWLAIAALSLAAAACGAESTDEAAQPASPADNQITIVRALVDEGDGGDAAIAGTIVLTNGCALIDLDEEGGRRLVAFPPDTHLADETITMPSGVTLREGSQVDGGGSYGSSYPDHPTTVWEAVGSLALEDCIAAAADGYVALDSLS